MNMLQIPIISLDLVEMFNSLNNEIKVLIAIIAIPLCMVLIYIAFKLIEIFFLLLKVIFDGFVKIFRKSSNIKKKFSLHNKKSETPEEIDSSKQEKDEEPKIEKFYYSDIEKKEEPIISEEGVSINKNIISINKSKHQESTTENPIRLINCPNCGNLFPQNSYSKIGDTLFASCEECGKRFITNGEIITENI